MKNYSYVTEIRSAIKSVTCDKCGKVCKKQQNNDLNYAEINSHFGYGSKLDALIYKDISVVLCEDCFIVFCATFKKVPFEMQKYLEDSGGVIEENK